MLGIFDSGVGGLSVVRPILTSFPRCDFIYFGDTGHFPYGTKSQNTIIEYARRNTKFLLSRGAKIIVIACNTASALASETLRREFKNLPIIDVISPVIEDIVAIKEMKRLGVIGTTATIDSQIYPRLIKKKRNDVKIRTQACPLLVSLIEEGWIDEPETLSILKHYLLPLKKEKIQYLVLSCTHYPLIQNKIEKVLGKNAKVINPATTLIKSLSAWKDLLSFSGKEEFYVSDSPKRFQKLSKIFLNREVLVKEVKI